MLDANEVKLTKTGKIELANDAIYITGFEASNASCRDVAALALTWAIWRLQAELMATLEKPGGGISVVD